MKWNSLKLSVGILLFVLFLNLLFSNFPGLYEILYYKSVYQLIRVLHDYSFGLLPFPSLYLILSLVLILIIFKLIFDRSSIGNFLLLLFIWTVNLFYLLWAFNYNQVKIKDKLQLYTEAIDSNYIKKSYLSQTEILDSLLDIQNEWSFDKSFEDDIRIVQERLLESWGYPVAGRVRVRKIIPGSLLHFRTSGIYLPHTFEGHIDNGLYELQHPFTLAHEMAHGYGFTDESECNFIAYLTCLMIDDIQVNYSAELAYWRYLASYYKKLFPKQWESEYKNLNPYLISDLKKIREHVAKFKDWMPKYRDKIYDNYLKTHGIKAGIRSYDQMVVLIKAYKEENDH